MVIHSFAASHNLPVLGPDSPFPPYYATHKLPGNTLTSDYLLSAKQSGAPGQTYLIDEFLGTDDYVFFGLGKGYFTRSACAGLVYDPFIIAEAPGATLVANDLLHVLDSHPLLQSFCKQHRTDITAILNTFQNPGQARAFWQAVDRGGSLLIAGGPPSPAHTFDHILESLPQNLAHHLKRRIQAEITAPNTITNNLQSAIEQLFAQDGPLLNSFFTETSEERMPELRVPQRYPVARGLTAVYTAP